MKLSARFGRQLRAWVFAVGVAGTWAAGYASQPSTEGLSKRLKSDQPAEQLAALEEVVERGVDAAALVPELTALLGHSDLAVRHEAIVALEAIGPAAATAVPQLQALLSSSDVILKYEALVALRLLAESSPELTAKVTPLLKDADPLVRIEAAAFLLTRGGATEDAAVAALAEALKSKRQGVRSAAIPWLSHAGAKAAPLLQELLKSGSPESQAAAVEAVAGLGIDAAPLVPSLLPLLSSSAPDVVEATADALGDLGSQPAETVPALQKLCGHADAGVKIAALAALSKFGPSAKPALTQFEHCLHDQDVLVRLAACDALATLGPAAQPALSKLVEALHDSEGAVTVRAAEALGQVGTAALPELEKLLTDERYGVLALHALEVMGPAARPAAPRLVGLLKNPGALPLRNLCLAVAVIGADAKTAGPGLRAVLAGEDRSARPAAAYALGRIGDRSSIKDLTNLLEDEQPQLRLAAAWSLLQLDRGNPELIKIAVPRLAEALTEPDVRVRREAARTLHQLGSAATSALPALVQAAGHDEDRIVRVECVLAIAEMGAAAAPAVAPLMVIAQEHEAVGRRTAMFALGRLGSIAVAAEPVLKKSLAASDRADRAVAAWALLQIADTAPNQALALPVIVEAIQRAAPEMAVPLVLVAGQCGHARPDVQRVLGTLMTAEDPALRAAAAAALDGSR